MDTSISKAEYETLASFRYLIRRFLHFSEDAAESVGLTPQQHQALLAIAGFPGRDHMTISELAERLQIRHNSAVGLVDRLVAQALITRGPAPDRRAVHLRLTAQGEELLKRLTATHREELRRLRPEIYKLLARLVARPSAGANNS